ncbi:MAG: hypothetical protein OXH57_11420 [Ekhidna sp.]|nr:hypothetical protein [Ekhidna sp.]
MDKHETILQKIAAYKSRFYRRQVIIGILSFLIFNVCILLLFSFIEYKLWLGSHARVFLLITLIAFSVITLSYLIVNPLLKILKIRKGKDDEDAAKDISFHFPEIEDKLINFLQLKQETSFFDQALILAALKEKSIEFEKLTFTAAVNFKPVRKYAFLFLAILVCFSLISFISPEIVRDSPKRIVNFNQKFERKMPFKFIIEDQRFSVFKGEDYRLSFSIDGDAIPEKIALIVNDKTSIALSETGDRTYEYVFEKVRTSKTWRIEAGGFSSKEYNLVVLERPYLVSMNIMVLNPGYTGAGEQFYTNTGDFTVLEGSRVLWEIKGQHTDETAILFAKDTISLGKQNDQLFTLEKRIFESSTYEIQLKNNVSKNKSKLNYKINVVADQFPDINAEFIPDSVAYQFITVAGTITDDYGFKDLILNYKTEESPDFLSIPIEINPSNSSQSFFATCSLDSFNLAAEKGLEMYLAVRDNDEINHFKTANSKTFILQIPSKEAFEKLIDNKSDEVENILSNSKKGTEDIADRLSNLENKLKTNPTFDWQEKKILEKVIKDKKEINEQIEELQKKYQKLQKSANKFNKQSDSQLKKNEKFEELMNDLIDEETRKLYEKLQELMEKNPSGDQINEQLRKLQRSERNLERDLERVRELFKRLKMEAQLESSLQQLDSLSKQQEQASKENILKESQKQQEYIQNEFKRFRESMKKVMDMNQELKRPEPLEDFEFEEKQITKELREIAEELKNQQAKEAQENNQKESDVKDNDNVRKNGQIGQKQKNAAQKMKSLSGKLSKMQGNMQMEMIQANLDQLRDILDNLLKLSFNQEDLMNEMRNINQSDPRFLELSQNQLKLRDDSSVIQDSLLALASRVVQLSSFVTREVENINQNIDEAIKFLKDKNRGKTLSSQQFIMTALNNLALLLDNTMQQMQLSMAEANGTGKGEKPQDKGISDLQELQKQLSQKMEELKGSGKSGRKLSEELARMAAEQELIRRELERLQEAQEGKPGNKGGDDLKKAIQMMEQNEIDLVNKRLSQQIIYRQKQIETRLLEAEKSQKEQEAKEEREAKRPSIISREIPPGFEEYLKLKKKEIELLRTIPIELNSFYKKEVNDYFRRISRGK